MYTQLPDDPVLSPSRLWAMDGNNSVKRLLTAASADARQFDSPFFLSREEVDRFQYEVKPRNTAAETSSSTEPPAPVAEDEDSPWLDVDHGGDATDGEQSKSLCADRWKASAAEHKKRALDIYDQTGMFTSACRHGTVLVACEMVRSGEL